MTDTSPPTDLAAPPSPSEPTVSEPEAKLVRRLEGVTDEALHRADQWIARAFVTIEQLRTAVASVARAHRALVDAAGVGVDVASPSVGEQWRRVVTYRREVRDRVLEPIRGFLHESEPSGVIAADLQDVLADIASLGEGIASEQALREPDWLFDAQSDDPWPHRLGKAAVRARRRLTGNRLAFGNGVRRVFGRPARVVATPTRLVVLRPLLLDFHLQVRLFAPLSEAHETLQRQLAQRVADLEGAITVWTQGVLDIEEALDDPSYHLPTAPIPVFARVPDVDIVDRWPALAERARSLQEGLDTAAAKLEVNVGLDESFRAATTSLTEDVHRAGTFLLRAEERAVPVGERSPAGRIERRREAWMAWHRQAVNRLVVDAELLTLRNTLVRLEDDLLGRVGRVSVIAVVVEFDRLQSLLRAARERASAACAPDSLQTAAALRQIREEVLEQIGSAVRDQSVPIAAGQALTDPARPEWEAVTAVVAELPDDLVVDRPPAAGRLEPVPGQKTLTLDLREAARDALAPPWPVQLAKPAEKLRERVTHVWHETDQIVDIVRYNLGAAAEELEHPTATSAAAGEEAPVDRARDLALGGLQRADRTLDELASTLEEPWRAFVQAMFETIQDDWSALTRRIESTAVVEEQWMGIWTRLERRAEGLAHSIRIRAGEALVTARRLFGLAQRAVERLIRRGQTVVGVTQITEDDHLASVASVVEVDALQETLPLVYRKLFSFEPVKDPAMFEGRSRDLVLVRQHLQRWQSGKPVGVLILTSPAGTGRSSILRVMRLSVFEGCQVHLVTLTRRVEDEATLAGMIAEALKVPLSEPTLAGLEMQLLAAPPPPASRVCLIDNLEHLLLQCFGGTDLLERVLLFFAHTDQAVFWVASVATDAWTLASKTVAAATGFATTRTLTPLAGEDVETIVINRHERSGMSLSFLAPERPSPLIRRRLRRAKSEEARQAVLREIFFDRLRRQCDQNIRLALFYWLRSAEFAGEEEVRIRTLEPLDFGFLKSMDLTRTFTLKSLYLHNTMTLNEHRRVFRLPEDRSVFVLESLLNLQLIEPAVVPNGKQGMAANARILPDVPYRIRPLLVQPVVDYLRSKHIVY